MKLMIIESPGKIKKLQPILGDDWKIVASFGHIRDLPKNSMGVSAPDFKPTYELTEKGADVVAKIKKLVQGADEIYLATDPDREGESIGWHLQQALKIKDYYRVSFNEITSSAVKKALGDKRKIDLKVVAAQEARRVLDRLVGYTVSPVLRNQSGQALSAGRVQSPAVRLVVDRENEIKAFKRVNHFGVMLNFDGNWRAEWITVPDFAKADHPFVEERSVAEVILNTKNVTVVDFGNTEAKKSPPPPFTTSTLQQAASIALSIDPKTTMDLAQKLYEQGHITYHRTDNPNLSEESMQDVRRVAKALNLTVVDTMRKFKAPESAQAGHPAITPTHWEIDQAGEDSLQRSLYELIRLRAIACQLEDARYAVRSTQLRATPSPVSGKEVHFRAEGRKLIHSGWLGLTQVDQADESDDEAESSNPIPALEKGQVIPVKSSRLLEKKTVPPERYTQASLIKKLESEGIGRPATYASIMDNITKKDYVRTEKKKLLPTEKGETIVNALKGVFSFIELGFTRDMEGDLDKIAHGTLGYKAVVTRMNDQLNSELGNLSVGSYAQKDAIPCQKCNGVMRRIPTKKGAFWGCSNYPTCDFSMGDDDGKPVMREERKQDVVSEFMCPDCGRPLVHKFKEGSFNFWGCSGFKDGCKVSMNDMQNAPDFQSIRRK